MNPLDDVSIDRAGLSACCVNALKAAGYLTIGSVVNESDERLMCLPGFGKQSLHEVRAVLSDERDRLPPVIMKINEMTAALSLAYGYLAALPDPAAKEIADHLRAVLFPLNGAGR